MSDMQPFTFPVTGQSVRTLLVDGEPMVCHVDVCQLLQHSNPSVAIQMVDEDDRCLIDLSESDIHALKRGIPGNARTWFLTESGFYTLALSSRAPGAHVLRRWITKEVIPSIRRTGSYSAPAFEIPTSFAEALELAARQQRELEATKTRAAAAEHQVLELAPAARMHDELMGATGDYSVREAAQILSRDPRIDTGQGRLFKYLREIGWLDRHNTPYQRHIDCGRITLRISAYEHPNRDEQVATQQVRITTKGLSELHQLLGGRAQFQALMSEEVSA